MKRLLIGSITLLLASTGSLAGRLDDDAVTVWWVIFNNPEACIDGCNGPDLFIPEVGGCVTHAAGRAVDQGGYNISTTIYKSVPSDGVMCELGTEGGLLNPMGAEIHLVLRTHGDASGDLSNFEQQISTFNGACPPNTCADVQFTIHKPNGTSSISDVRWIGRVSNLINAGVDVDDAEALAGQLIPGASSTLNRTPTSATMTIVTSLDH